MGILPLPYAISQNNVIFIHNFIMPAHNAGINFAAYNENVPES